ncbi:MAG: hypothetical protein ABFR63_05680 [Thermodesulfobacteriota bacterium]
MKRVVMLVCLFAMGMALLGSYSLAGNGVGCNKGCRGQSGQGVQQVMDAETKKKYEKFMAETVDLRKELEEKAAAYQALMSSGNQDPVKAAQITEEFFQLRDFVTNKAVEAGIVQKRGGCNGCSGKDGVACGLPGAKTKKVEQTN